MPTLAALFFVSMVALLQATYVPAELAQKEARIADAGATSFLAYRRAVVDYLNANPGFSGTVPDSALTFLWGYARDQRWTNEVSPSGTLFVYETRANSAGTAQVLDKLYQQTLSSYTVGRNAGGSLISARGVATGVALPASVPDGALVMIGR